ncbi:MAG: hypothetical protein WCS43_00790 [Verrucomicrobiota bacterium]
MANEHNISPFSVHYGPPVQPLSILASLTCGMANPWITKEEGSLPRQEDQVALAEQKTAFREVRMLQLMPVPILAKKSLIESEVSIGPLLTGITMLALMRRFRR